MYEGDRSVLMDSEIERCSDEALKVVCCLPSTKHGLWKERDEGTDNMKHIGRRSRDGKLGVGMSGSEEGAPH